MGRKQLQEGLRSDNDTFAGFDDDRHRTIVDERHRHVGTEHASLNANPVGDEMIAHCCDEWFGEFGSLS